VREAILGHVQQGGDPSPFDRIQATRLAARCVEYLITEAGNPTPASAMIGLQAGRVRFSALARLPEMVEPGVQRPARQDWLALRTVAAVMSASLAGPSAA
jgi:6-phosphofructokinase 1